MKHLQKSHFLVKLQVFSLQFTKMYFIPGASYEFFLSTEISWRHLLLISIETKI